MFKNRSIRTQILAFSLFNVTVFALASAFAVYTLTTTISRERQTAEYFTTAMGETERLMEIFDQADQYLLETLVKGSSEEDENTWKQTYQKDVEARIQSVETSLNTLSQEIPQKQIPDFKPKKAISDIKETNIVFEKTADTIFAAVKGQSAASDAGRIAAIQDGLSQLSTAHEKKQIIQTSIQFLAVKYTALKSTMEQQVTRTIMISLIALSGVILLSLITAFLAARSISAQLHKAYKDGEEIITRKYDKPLSLAVQNEIGDFIKLLIQVAGKLKEADSTLEAKIKTRTDELEKIKNELEKTVAEQTAQSAEKIKELETLNKAMIGRELKMAHLKQEISELKQKTQSEQSPIIS